MSSPLMRKTGYQNPCNKLGYITSTQISHPDRKIPSRSVPLVRTTIYDEKPLEYVMKNPLPQHDGYLTTTNDIYHRRKYYDYKYAQPSHPIAPSLENIHYIKPWALKIGEKSFNPQPIYDCSESKDAFKARHPIADIYGDPVYPDPIRNVYVPIGRDHVEEFDNDEPSTIRAAHPYLSQSQFAHRRFRPEELAEHSTMNRLFHEKPKDVAIKLRIIPVEGPFEQKLSSTNTLPNYDVKKEASSPNDYSNQKYFFRRPLYRGCPPRVFKPVPRLGWAPLTQESYGWPFHCFNKENTTCAFAMCMYQPKQTFAEARKVPWMYTTESQTYGRGRPVSTFINIHGPNTREWASNIIGEDCHFSN
ncbi:unnamed protein product [Allacma fusca]|uniref:Uncharacterized protein n=1 Tax=Allacma fusca TaxID=39272 RepID=A0A8J2NU27_9HEXA|nr:unnamed protein product [Allacma fusca]